MKQTKRSTPYEGDDIKDFVNANRFHRSMSEAHRDADYASWFEKDPEMSDMKLFITELVLIGLPMIAIAIAIVCGIVKSLGL
jgi:hypothetical protein